MDRRVVPELGEVQKLVPTAWVVTNETPEVCFKSTVDHLCLAVRLRVIGGAILQCCTLDPK